MIDFKHFLDALLFEVVDVCRELEFWEFFAVFLKRNETEEHFKK